MVPLTGIDSPEMHTCAIFKFWKADLPPEMPNSVPNQYYSRAFQCHGNTLFQYTITSL